MENRNKALQAALALPGNLEHLLWHITRRSKNKKTGEMPVTTSAMATCPPSCPFNNGGGCYAASGPLLLHWRKVSSGDRGLNWEEFLAAIRAFPEGILWRHNQAGDLPGIGEEIDLDMLAELVTANKGKKGFTYTHKELTPSNVAGITAANTQGFTINISANNLRHADEIRAAHPTLPVAVTVPEHRSKTYKTAAGNKVVTCPATYRDTSCVKCKLCAIPDRDYMIAFPVHGTSKRKAALVAAG